MLPARLKTPTVILVAGCLSMLLAFGFRNSFGVLFTPMLADFNWGPRGAEVLGLSLALQNLVWGISQPIAGTLADRYGSGRVIAFSALIYALGLAGSALVTQPLGSHLFVGLLIGVGLGGTSNAIILSVVGRAFPAERRSTALGIATAAASGGQFLIVPLAAELLTQVDWRTVLWLFAAGCALILCISPLLAGRPSRRPGQPGQVQGLELVEQSVGQALQEAFQHGGYLLLVAGFFVCGFHVTFIGVHLPPYIISQGLPPTVGAYAIALIGFANVFGSIYAGILGNRGHKPHLLAYIYAGRAVVILLYILLPISALTTYVFALAMGLLWLSTVPLTAGLVGQIFGLRHLSLLFGLVFVSHQVGSFLGSWLGGRFFAATGSYDAVWWMSVALGAVAALLHWPIRPQPVPRLALGD